MNDTWDAQGSITRNPSKPDGTHHINNCGLGANGYHYDPGKGDTTR